MALRGMERFLGERSPVILIELCGYALAGLGGSVEELVLILQSYGYAGYTYERQEVRPLQDEDLATANRGDINALFSRSDPRGRLASA